MILPCEYLPTHTLRLYFIRPSYIKVRHSSIHRMIASAFCLPCRESCQGNLTLLVDIAESSALDIRSSWYLYWIHLLHSLLLQGTIRYDYQ
jgi:hypothetical protein